MRHCLVSLVIAGVSARAAAALGAELPAPTIPGVVAAGTRTEVLATGLQGTEGVISLPDGTVIFCEFNANRIVHIDAAGHFSTYLEDSNRPTGLGFDVHGRLIAAESRNPRLEVLSPRRRTLVDSFKGQPLVRPNDLVADTKGGLYFTDPIPDPKVEFRAPPSGRKPLLFYITPRGKLEEATDTVTHPNGVELSPDGRTLYAVDGANIVAFDVQPDGAIGNPRGFAQVSGDGLAVDNGGRLYVATLSGVAIFAATGQSLGLIATPTKIQSIAFAGPGRRTLYVVGGGAVYRIPLLVQGISGRAK